MADTVLENPPNTITAAGIDSNGNGRYLVLEFETESYDDDQDSSTYDTWVAVYRVRQVLK